MTKEFDDGTASAGVAAAGTTQGFAERSGDDVDATHHITVFGSASPGAAHETDSMRIVDHDEGIVFVGQITDRLEIGDVAVHRENTVGGDQAATGIPGLNQFRLEVGHVVVGIAKSFGFAEADAVDD